jgi:hypothetical protein
METMDSWNFTVERQLANDTTLSVAYVGSKGTHIDWQYNMNAAPPGPGPLLQRRPFYQKYGLDTSINMLCNCSDSNYNSLQIQVRKTYAKNLAFTANFTWQKSLGYYNDNPIDRSVDYGVGSGDSGAEDATARATTFTLGHTIIFPYGRGQRWGSSAGRAAQAALGGWQFSGVTILESGAALDPNLSSNATLNADFNQKPNRVPGCDPAKVSGGQNASHWFNPACFATPAQFQYGNVPPGSFNGPPIANADFSLWKEFSLSTFLNREKTSIQLRVESYNVFNLTNLGTWTWGTCVDCTAGNVISNLQPGFPMRRFQFGLHMSW